MLPKVVRTWPDLFLLGTVRCSAHVTFADADLVNALFVSVQVVLGGETLLPVAAWYVALERFHMAQYVFPVPCQSLTVEARLKLARTCIQTCS